MNDNNIFYLLLLIVLISIVKSAESISCYQCNSTDTENQFQCTEFMDTYGLSAHPCTDVYSAAYCIKLVGRYEGGLGVKRYCSSHDLGNYCNYVKQPGDKMEYRTCVYTCDSDGCNGSSRQIMTRCGMVHRLLIFIAFNYFTIISIQYFSERSRSKNKYLTHR